MAMPTLFDAFQLGDIPLSNRIVMAPLTRNRAVEGNKPGALTVEYYRQRATAGLIIAEASQISPMAQGYYATPGIYSPEQVSAWRKVTDAVHEEGGRMFIQLWHVGRISHVSLLPGGASPLSSTDKPANAMTFTQEGFQPVSKPRALRDDELPSLVADYAHAARCAMEAGFDGVEVHCANTYLLEQFLRDSVNDRQGPYGGCIENRARLPIEVMQAVVDAIGPGRTGIRLSPMTRFQNTTPLDSRPQTLYGYLVEQLAPLNLAYMHIIEGETGGPRVPEDAPIPFDYDALRRPYRGAWMVNNGYMRADALEAVESGHADLVAFGRPFISNPDLVRRLRDGTPLNVPDVNTFYGGGAVGYVDYPMLPE